MRPRPLQTPAAPPAATPRRSAPRAASSCRNAPSPKTVTSSRPRAVGRIVFSSLRVCPYLGGGWLLRAALGHLPCLPAPVTPGRVSFCREHPCLTLSESPRSAVSRGRRELGRWVLLIPLRVPGECTNGLPASPAPVSRKHSAPVTTARIRRCCFVVVVVYARCVQRRVYALDDCRKYEEEDDRWPPCISLSSSLSPAVQAAHKVAFLKLFSK